MRFPILGLAGALALAACGSNQALLARRSQSEAQQLQQYCRKAGLNNAETAKADVTLGLAAKQLSDGNEEEAAIQSDRAATLYRLALARKDLADAQAQVAGLKEGLAKDRELLQTYQEILGEMKTVRKP
jgi:hypothetical protein